VVRVSFEKRPSVAITASDRSSVRVLEIDTLKVNIDIADATRNICVKRGLFDADKTDSGSSRNVHFFVAAVTVAVCSDSAAGMKDIAERPTKLVDVVLSEVWGRQIFCTIWHESSLV
jgi:hypothetical protein